LKTIAASYNLFYSILLEMVSPNQNPIVYQQIESPNFICTSPYISNSV